MCALFVSSNIMSNFFVINVLVCLFLSWAIIGILLVNPEMMPAYETEFILMVFVQFPLIGSLMLERRDSKSHGSRG
jgi:hypothetical protein